MLKAKRLKELGFTYAKQADIKEGLSQLSEGEIGIIEAEKLHYYQIRYPNNKYITLTQVKTKCEKYNLLFADVCRYKGFVPSKKCGWTPLKRPKVSRFSRGTFLWRVTAVCENYHFSGYSE